MISSISGKLTEKGHGYLVVDVSGFGIKTYISKNIAEALPPIGSSIFLYTGFFVKKDGIELYGFLDKKDLEIFELLNSINGVGPKTALSILDSVKTEKLLSAIQNNKADIITENSNLGRKKAEKIVLELRDKIKGQIISDSEFYESDKDVVAALKSLGYKSRDIDDIVGKIPNSVKTVSDRLKFALKSLSQK